MKGKSNLERTVFFQFLLYVCCLVCAIEAKSEINVTLTAIDPPVFLPVSGGSFDYNLRIDNTGSATDTFDAWIEVTLPDSTPFGPLIVHDGLDLPAGALVTRRMTQDVPYRAPWGMYIYHCNIGEYPVTIADSDTFHFYKAP